MCNAWNHQTGCRCGWGGEGHLGRRTFGNFDSPTPGLLFFTTNRSSKVGSYDSFVVPNAKCPVCGEPVYFYQSEHGGRVFFDSLGWPWPKHLCTDNRVHSESRAELEFIGEPDDHEIIRLITEFDEEGYFPLVCSRTKGRREIGAEFLYPDSSMNHKFEHVCLRLNSPIAVSVGAIFFIREVDAKNKLYHLRFCFRKGDRKKITFDYCDATIDTFKRPILKHGRVIFRDFTGVRVMPALKIPNITIKKASKGKRSRDSHCKYCGGAFLKSKISIHSKRCAKILVKCELCNEAMPRFSLKFHRTKTCRFRSEKGKPQ